MVAPLPNNLKRVVVCEKCGWNQTIKNPTDCITEMPSSCPQCNSSC